MGGRRRLPGYRPRPDVWHWYENDKGKRENDVAKITYTEKSDFVVYDGGTYPAQVRQIEPTTGDFGPQFRFRFVLLDTDGNMLADDDGQPCDIVDWCSQKLNPKTKLYDWILGILGDESSLSEGFDFDTDILIGKTCQLVVSLTQAKNGSDKNKISMILPWFPGKTARAMRRVMAINGGTTPNAQPKADDNEDSNIPF